MKKSLHPSWLVVATAVLIVIIVAVVQIFGLSKTSQTTEFLNQFIGRTVTVSGKIAKDPTLADSKTSIILTDLKLETFGTYSDAPSDVPSDADALSSTLSGKLYVTFSTYATSKTTPAEILGTTEDPERSDILTITGKIEPSFGTFVASMKNPTVLSLDKSGDVFLKIRAAFADQIRLYIRGIPAATNEATDIPESGLELGYLLGMKTAIDDNLEEALRIVGLTHIIVASGTHLGILASFSRKIFGKLSRFAGLLGATLLIVVFVGITGLTPSMTRAAFVALLSLVAWYFGRDAAPWRILLYAAAVTLLINPDNFLDLAWQLSFGSFTGLMLLSPIFVNFFYGDQKPNFLGASLITSLSTILCCAPILIFNFGAISFISIVANLLILPTIAPVMALGVITGIFGLLATNITGLSILAAISGFLTSLILKYHIATVNFLSSQTAFIIELEKGNPLVFLLWLIPCVFIVITATKTHRARRNAKSQFPS